MLSRNKRLDDTSYEPLLVDVNERLELHRGWKRDQVRKHFGMGRRLKGVRFRINVDMIVRCGRVDEIRQKAVAVQLG